MNTSFPQNRHGHGKRVCTKKMTHHLISHRIHVWNVYLHLPFKKPTKCNVGKYTIHGSYGYCVSLLHTRCWLMFATPCGDEFVYLELSRLAALIEDITQIKQERVNLCLGSLRLMKAARWRKKLLEMLREIGLFVMIFQIFVSIYMRLQVLRIKIYPNIRHLTLQVISPHSWGAN